MLGAGVGGSGFGVTVVESVVGVGTVIGVGTVVLGATVVFLSSPCGAIVDSFPATVARFPIE